MGKEKGLTIKQERFVNKYLECGNASEAYRFAYDCSNLADSTIWSKSSLMLDDNKVRARVEELREEIKDKSNITKEGNLAILYSIMNDKAESPAVRIKAIEVSNKMLGFDAPEKREITGKDGKDLMIQPLTIEIVDSREKADKNE